MSVLVIDARTINRWNLLETAEPSTRLYPKWVYEKAGFTCRYHFFRNDEFYLNGVKLTQAEANTLMERMGWEIRESRLPGRDGLVFHATDIYHNGKLVSR